MMKKAFNAVGVIVTAAAVLFAGVYAYNAGWIHQVIPDRPVAAAVSIDLHGPKQTLVGQEYYFHVEATGVHGPVKWELIPASPTSLTPSLDGMKARFQSNETGVFSVVVSVGGPAMQSDSDHIEFENLNVVDATSEEEYAAEPPPTFTPPTLPPAPTVSDYVLQAYADVPSATKAVEAATVVGCLRSLANRLKTGQLPPSADVAKELTDHVELALGERASAWGLFLAEMRHVLGLLRSQGDVTTAAGAAPALLEAANALASVTEH